MDPNEKNFGDKVEEEDDDDKYNEFKIHEGIILAVHLTNSMTDNLTAIFTTFLNLLITLIKTMPNTGLGLYIFNCSKENINKNETPEGIYRIFRLQDLNQGMLKTLDRYLRNSLPTETVIDISFNTEEQWSKLLPIKDANVNESFGHSLFTMLQQSLLDFNNLPYKTDEYTSKKIFIFTDCETPFNGDENIKQKIHSKLRDLNDFKITVYPFILNNNSNFNDNKKIVSNQLNEFKQLFDFPLATDLESRKYLPSINEISLDKLEEKLIKHATVKRMAFQCPLIFGNLRINVKGINPFTQVEWKKVSFYNHNNRLRFVKRKVIHTSNNIEITPDKIKKVYEICDHQFIGIDEQIQKECMKFGESEKPILHIVGIRKFENFNPSYTIGKSLFMIANDEIENDDSLVKFAAIYKSLCKKNMIALCWGMIRKISYPRFYYLIPTSIMKKSSVLTFENYPQALAVIEFPFGNEIRKAPDYVEKLDSLSELDESKKLDELIKATTLKQFVTLPNPSLSWKFKVMEDHILQKEIPITKSIIDDNDNIIPSYTDQQLKMDEMYQKIVTFKEKIENDSDLNQLVNDLKTRYNRVANYNELKRISEESSVKKSTKKSKGSKDIGRLTDVKAVIFYKEFGLKNCTNDILRDYISSKGGIIKTGKNKSEMIMNIVDYLRKNDFL